MADNPLDEKAPANLSSAKRDLLSLLVGKEAARRAAQGGASSAAIARASREHPLPLSFAQRRLWFLDQLQPGSPLYNLSGAVRLGGRLDVAALERALGEIVRRHEALRTTFAVREGDPVQVVAAAEPLPLPVMDISALPPGERPAEAQRLLDAEARRPFDLTKGPLLRALLLRLSEDEHVLLLSMHHIVSDGWSMGVLFGEATRLYEAFAGGSESPLPDLAIQYADYAAWQREWLRGEVLESQLDYWKQQLQDAPPMLELPTDRPRPPVQTYVGAHHHHPLDARLTAGVREMCRREGVTPFMLLLAAFKLLLFKYTGQPDVAVGTPIANRNRPEIEPLIGFFVNTLVMRTDLSGDPSVKGLLQRVRDVALGAYTHQDMPFEKLVEELHPARSLSHSPLFQVTFALNNAQRGEAQSTDLARGAVDVRNAVSKFDLTLSVSDDADRLGVTIEYNTDLFDEATISRMAGHYQTLLEGFVSRPERRISELPLLTEAEYRQVVVRWNDTRADYPRDTCIHHLFEERAGQRPDAIAVISEDERLSYGELNRRANQLAHHLRRQGVGPDVRVGILMERSPGMVVAQLGVLKAGGAYVPMDPTYPKERLAFMIEDSAVPVLLTQRHLLGEFTLSETRVLCLDTDWHLVAGESAENPRGGATAANLSYVIYTSGSTGRPKGILLHHEGLCNLIADSNRLFDVHAESRVLQFASPSFDVSVWETFMALVAGGTLCLASRHTFFSHLELLERLRGQAIDVALLAPSLMSLLPPAELPGLRTIIAVGEKVTSELAEAWSAGRHFFNGYGPAEASVTVSAYLTRSDETYQQGPPIGRPLANTELYVLDRDLQPLPAGLAGELHIGGIQLARGYLNRPALTAEKFIPHPFSPEPGARLYKTGDVVRYRPDGNLEFVGRVDHQVKIRGYRVEPGEVEATLGEHPEVRECVVSVLADTSGQKRLVAYVLCEREPAPTVNEFRQFLREKLPDYMVPSAFVVLDEWPRSPNGKVDRGALPGLESVRPQLEATYVAPQTEVERAVAGVWQELLKIEKVGVNDNFFDLGGHSLLMVQLHDRIRELFGRDLTMVEMFKYTTVQALANHLAGEPGARAASGQAAGDASSQARQRAEKQESAGRARGQAEDEDEGAEPGSISVADEADSADRVAIVGMACRFPKARNAEEFWRNLRAGQEAVTFFTDRELLESGVSHSVINAPGYVKAHALLEDVDLFDAAFFDFSPKEAEITDPQQRVFLECAWEALENAGCDPKTYGGLIGIFGGVGVNHYLFNLLSHPELLGAMGWYKVVNGNDKDHLSTRVAYELNLRGPSFGVQSTCSTSLVAVHVACQNLLDYHCDVALAGAVSFTPGGANGYFALEGVNSPDGHCRAFDERARGLVPGGGVGIVVLKRLSDALADGDHIHAVIRGSAVNNDGLMKAGYSAPSVDGQAAAIAMAQAVAGVSPESVTYVETHGTATPVGDPIEVAALTQVFRAGTDRKGFCAIGSVKTNIGHTDTAAGVAGLIKTVLALKHAEIPPSLHFERPNPQIDFEASPFFVNTRLTEWRRNGTPLRAGVSAFGQGGTNAHVVVEEAPATEPSGPSRPWQLLLLSAKTETALEKATDNLAAHLGQHSPENFADVAFTLQAGRRGFGHRRFVVCRDAQDAVSTLEGRDPRRILSGTTETGARPVAFMFPGVGDHYVNMGLGLYRDEPAFREQVDLCCEFLRPHLGLDLREVLYPQPGGRAGASGEGEAAGSGAGIDLRKMLGRSAAQADGAADRLNRTLLLQPALFVVEYALARLWMKWGIRPQAMLGYSIGEYVAAALAGVFSLEDALLLVTQRARMIEESPGGVMMAVSLPEGEVRPLLGTEVSLAAVMGPSLCVVAGTAAAVAELEGRLPAEVVRRPVHSAHAFHSKMMRPLLRPFAEVMQGVSLRAPEIPFVSNVTGTWITPEQATDPNYWATHMCLPVRFADGLAELWKQPDRIFIEVGPGQSLCALALQQRPRTAAAAATTTVLPSLHSSYERQPDQAFLLNSLGSLWLAGIEIDWSGFYGEERRRRVPLPTYPFERQRYMLERRGRASQARQSAGVKTGNVADWFYLPVWKRLLPLRTPDAAELAGRRLHWLIFVDECGLGAELARRLSEAGQEVSTVTAGEVFGSEGGGRYTVNPRSKDDYSTLLAEIRARGGAPHRIVHLWSVTEARHAPANTEAFEGAQFAGCYSLLFLTQSLASHGLAWHHGEEDGDDGLLLQVVSNNVQAVVGDEMLEPEKATILGPCKTIPQEYQKIACQSVDIALPAAGTPQRQQLAAQLLAELQAGHPDPVVAYRAGARWVRAFEPLRPDETGGAPRLRKGGVYLMTGGLGKDSLTRAEYLAREWQARLVLVGRTRLPQREGWDDWLASRGEDDAVSLKIRKVRELERLGAEVLVAAANVADEDEMRAVLKEVEERFGHPHGVVHAAGITSISYNKEIADIEVGDMETQFEAKVRGTYVLERVLRGRELDFCILTSSLAAITGLVGLSAYVSANVFMDAFAQRHNQTSRANWLSLDWQGGDAWQTAEAFRRLLALPPVAQVVTSAEDLESLEQRLKLDARRRAEVVQKPAHARPNLRNVYVAPRNETEQKIVELWEGLLGVKLGVHDSFMELGGDSMLAVQLISRIGRTFGINLRLGNLFETPTVAALAETLERMRAEASAPPDDSAPADATGAQESAPRTAPASSSSLVGIQTEGSRRPFFCVHPSGGNVFCFVNLARHLGYDQPFYGLQARGLAQGQQPYASIEEMAAHYVDALRASQPVGPYLLGGWSLGGIVAFEMAQQLRGGGHEVELLALIDVATSVCGGDVTGLDDNAAMVSFAHELVHTWGITVPVETFRPLWGDIENVAGESRLDYILQQARAASIIPADVELPDGQQLLQVYRSNMKAGRAYVPKPYPGRITVIRAAESSGAEPDATLGWGALAQAGVEVHTAPGNHYSMMREPNVRELARFLKLGLDGAGVAETLRQT